MTGRKPFLGLLQRKTLVVPTWKGWISLLAVVVIGGVIAVRNAYWFLAVNDPVHGGILVVEGWSGTDNITSAADDYRRNSYSGVFVTGFPIESASPLARFGTTAELGAATLRSMGMDPKAVQAVPSVAVIRDRTFATAVALRQWLHEHGITPGNVNIIGSGAHSRRTRLIYEKAFGNGVRIGVIRFPEKEFDPDRWWASSQGFRTVIDELVAYFYARFLFSPGRS